MSFHTELLRRENELSSRRGSVGVSWKCSIVLLATAVKKRRKCIVIECVDRFILDDKREKKTKKKKKKARRHRSLPVFFFFHHCSIVSRQRRRVAHLLAFFFSSIGVFNPFFSNWVNSQWVSDLFAYSSALLIDPFRTRALQISLQNNNFRSDDDQAFSYSSSRFVVIVTNDLKKKSLFFQSNWGNENSTNSCCYRMSSISCNQWDIQQ